MQSIVGDAERLLELVRQGRGNSPMGIAGERVLMKAAELLSQLLMQDVERKEDRAAIKEGVSRDRIVSVHGPEMCHGHKSNSTRFDGYKAAVVVDTGSHPITAVEVLPGNAPDNTGVLELVKQSEENTGMKVEETIGDGATR